MSEWAFNEGFEPAKTAEQVAAEKPSPITIEAPEEADYGQWRSEWKPVEPVDLSEGERALVAGGNKGFDRMVDINHGDVSLPLQLFMGADSATAAKVQRIIKERGIPKEASALVKENAQEFENWNNAIKILDRLSEKDEDGNLKFPGTNAWINDPSRVERSHASIHALSDMESFTIDAYGGYLARGADSLKQGLKSVFTSTVGSIGSLAEDSGIPMDDTDYLDPELYAKREDFTDASGVFDESRWSTAVDKKKAERRDMLHGRSFGRAINAFLQKNVVQHDAFRPNQLPDADSLSEEIARMLAGLVPQIGAQVATSIASPALGISFMTSQIQGGSYNEGRAKGLSHEQAFSPAVVNAAFQLPMEAFSLSKLFKIFTPATAGARRIFLTTLESAFTGFGSETAQGIPEAGARLWQDALVKGKDPFSYVIDNLDVAETLKESYKEGLAVSVFSILGGAARIAPEITQYRQHVTDLAFVDRIREWKAKNANFDADTMGEAITHITGGIQSAPSVAVVPGEVLSQYMQDDAIKALVESQPELADEINDAAKTGQDVSIPFGAYSAHIVGTPLEETLKGMVNFREGFAGPRTDEELKQVLIKSLDEAREEGQTLAREQIAVDREVSRIRDKLKAAKIAEVYTAEDLDHSMDVFTRSMQRIAESSGEALFDVLARVDIQADGEVIMLPRRDDVAPMVEAAQDDTADALRNIKEMKRADWYGAEVSYSDGEEDYTFRAGPMVENLARRENALSALLDCLKG